MSRIGIAILAVTLFGCDLTDANHAPEIEAIQMDDQPIKPCELRTVSALVTDEDGDALTFFWTATGGGFSEEDENPTTWAAPEGGEYVLTVTANDGRDTDSRNRTVLVDIGEDCGSDFDDFFQ